MKNSSNTLFKFILILILILLLGLGAIKIGYENALKKPNGTGEEKIVLEITEGESVDGILKSLIEKGLLQQKYYYYAKYYLKVNDLGPKLQAGIYELPKQLNMIELIDSLQLGKNQDLWVLIPEGLRKDEIAKILSTELSKSSSSTFSEEEFLSLTEDEQFIKKLGLEVEVNDLEGFLFPDKYAFPQSIDSKGALEKLIENFKNKIGTEYTYQDIILASIVEREGYNSKDRPVIAGIIIKRFEEGWLLQTDATLLYPVKDWKHSITIQDKEDDNPYNTYKNIGLPPTPICNSGLEAIEAVQNPESSDYYYYIHDNDGNPHYATTLDQHNANVNRYLR